MEATLRELVTDEDEILLLWAQIMMEWGHYKTAQGLRFPTSEEVRGTRRTRAVRRGSPGDIA